MTVKWRGQRVLSSIEEAVMRSVVRGTEAVRARAVSLIMSGSKTGRIYYRNGIAHQASAPGEAPASDTGQLAQSIRTEYDREQLSGKVVSRAPHGAALEFGTEKMEPRPYLRPALAAEAPGIAADMQREIAIELRRMG